MRVAFDGTTLTPQRTGIGYYTEYLLGHLTAEFTGDEWMVLSNRPLAVDTPLHTHQRVVTRGLLPWRTPWIQLTAPRLLSRTAPDVAHFTNSIGPLCSPVPMVVTIHDMSLELFPRLHPRRRRLTRWLVRCSARKARAIIAVSESSRHNIQALLGISAHRIRVIPEAAAPFFKPVRDESPLRRVRERYRLPERFILHVGTIEPRKNLVSLVRAYSCLAETESSDLGLVLAGNRGWGIRPVLEEIETLGLQDRVLLPGYVELADLPALYSLALATVYPSLHEGFGLPVIEAMACGCPVVTSANSSLIEVAGNAALLLENPEPDQIAGAIRRILGSRDLRNELAGRSIENAARFSWSTAAAATRQVYQEAARSG